MMATAVGSTHPTGMHSCFFSNLFCLSVKSKKVINSPLEV